MRARLLAGLLLAAWLLAAIVGPATAQAALELRIRQAELSPDGETRLLVSVTGGAATDTVLDAGVFSVREGGQPIDGVTVSPLLESAESPPLGVLLVVDVSGSTAGEPLEAARTAASAFAHDVATGGASVGLISFGPTAQLLAPLTTDADAVDAGLATLVADGETALYDGVILASQALADFEGLREIVVFSDGADTVSTGTLEEATALASDVGSSVTTLALATDALDRAALRILAEETDGTLIEAGEAVDLAAAFDQAAAAIAGNYTISYSVADEGPAELDVAVTATVGQMTAEDRVTVVNPRQAALSATTLQPAVVSDPGPLARPEALWVGLGTAFVALALLLGLLTFSVKDESETRRLQRSLHAYTTGGTSVTRSRDLTATGISKRAASLVDRVPKPAGFDDELQHRIDRAAWPLRSSEFIAVQFATAIGAALLAWALTGNILFGLGALVIGALAPRAVLDRRISRRSSEFLEQLPDTLGLLAGSLKAGYGLVQAIDTVVREAPAPTSEEFARVLTEVRLGMPLSQALDGMVERTASEDFGWAVMAINIQSEVGGNLAQLLETVATTIRERAQVQRQIRTLSAEGRLSAIVLVSIAPVMALYMLLVNGDYVSMLWTTSMGRAMLAVGLALLLVGVMGIRKVIDIDV